MTIEMRRRGFLGALIGAALAPRLIFSSMTEPVQAAVLEPLKGLSLIESEIFLPPGLIHAVHLRGTAEQSKHGNFALTRQDGARLVNLNFNCAGGWLNFEAGRDALVAIETHPILISSDADIEGHIMFCDFETGRFHVAKVEDGRVLRIVPLYKET